MMYSEPFRHNSNALHTLQRAQLFVLCSCFSRAIMHLTYRPERRTKVNDRPALDETALADELYLALKAQGSMAGVYGKPSDGETMVDGVFDLKAVVAAFLEASSDKGFLCA